MSGGVKRTNPGYFGPIRAIAPPGPRTSFTAPTCNAGRRACRSPSIPDPDRLRRRSSSGQGEVGKVGVPISHLGDMLTLMDGLRSTR